MNGRAGIDAEYAMALLDDEEAEETRSEPTQASEPQTEQPLVVTVKGSFAYGRRQRWQRGGTQPRWRRVTREVAALDQSSAEAHNEG